MSYRTIVIYECDAGNCLAEYVMCDENPSPSDFREAEKEGWVFDVYDLCPKHSKTHCFRCGKQNEICVCPKQSSWSARSRWV